MLSIRLSRVGKKKAPVYRVVVMPKHRDPWANSVEILGHYNPRREPRELVLNADRVKYWIEQGAQPTDTVWNLLIDEKIVEGEKRGVTSISKKRKGKMEQKATETKEKKEAAKAKVEEAATAPVEAETSVEPEAVPEQEAAPEPEAAPEAEPEVEAPASAEATADKPAEEESEKKSE